MVHYTKVINGIVEFIDHDMISKMAGNWRAWGIGTIVALVARRAPEIFNKLKSNPMVETMGLIDGEMVDVDAIYSELIKQSQKSSATVEFPLIGPVAYSSADVEELYRCILR